MHKNGTSDKKLKLYPIWWCGTTFGFRNCSVALTGRPVTRSPCHLSYFVLWDDDTVNLDVTITDTCSFDWQSSWLIYIINIHIYIYDIIILSIAKFLVAFVALSQFVPHASWSKWRINSLRVRRCQSCLQNETVASVRGLPSEHSSTTR